jgi:type 1 glutamine amidotransferase/sugar phosphate isomerase/epimerase
VRIEQALPPRAIVPPRKPRTLLIFDLNVGYGGHGSIAHANHAFAAMGERTGAFGTVVSRDPAIFRPENLRRFDAVFLNNTVGNLFTDPALRQSFLEFILRGGGLLGVHGTSVAFTQWPGALEDWPEFGRLLGGRGANHRDSDERVVIRLDDPGHPLTQVFGGQGFEYRDEFFRVHEPYSRHRVRVLLSIDTDRTDMNQGQPRGNCARADNDYALAWIRQYGRGRVFYCTIAHNPYVFWDPQMLRFYLAALQFALGDLPAPTTPSHRLTPARRAQEKLGWRLGAEVDAGQGLSLFDAVDGAAALGLVYLGSGSGQTVSPANPQRFGPHLSDDELRLIRLKLDDAGVRLLTYHLDRLPTTAPAARQLFLFGQKLGVEAFLGEAAPEALDMLERCCDEYDIRLGLTRLGGNDSLSPRAVLRACRGRSRRLGAAVDTGDWLRSGIDPVRAVRVLRERLVTLQLQDRAARGPGNLKVPWGTGAGRIEPVLKEIARLGLPPTMFALALSADDANATAALAPSIDFFNAVSLQLAGAHSDGVP